MKKWYGIFPFLSNDITTDDYVPNCTFILVHSARQEKSREKSTSICSVPYAEKLRKGDRPMENIGKVMSIQGLDGYTREYFEISSATRSVLWYHRSGILLYENWHIAVHQNPNYTFSFLFFKISRSSRYLRKTFSTYGNGQSAVTTLDNTYFFIKVGGASTYQIFIKGIISLSVVQNIKELSRPCVQPIFGLVIPSAVNGAFRYGIFHCMAV